jgi:hypothetical protein
MGLLVMGLAGTGPSCAAEAGTVQPAASESSVFPTPGVNGLAAGQTEQTIAAPEPSADTAASTSENTAVPSTDATVNAVAASNDDSSGWDKASIIGKIFIACGTLLTLGSAARMFMV